MHVGAVLTQQSRWRILQVQESRKSIALFLSPLS